jgi:hypothetical protein
MLIPKIIHQIWIGPNKQPDVWMDTVRSFCSQFEYEYKLWTEREISEITLINDTMFREEHRQLCGRADILRYEVLYMYGGCYIDADTVVINPTLLNDILQGFNHETGFGIERGSEEDILIANGVCISLPGGIFMKACIDALPSRDHRFFPWVETGPCLITDVYKGNPEFKETVFLFPRNVFYPNDWIGLKTIDEHTRTEFPKESVMFQYGYSTNNLSSII